MASERFLSKIKSPGDLRGLSLDDLDVLCEEIRLKLIEIVSKNGGHLASNLGVVELTVALHRAFEAPEDKIIWDVGHQCYTHKMLTGRLDKLDTIRKEGGLSGFPKRNESAYDPFNVGHSSTSISAAFGIAKAKEIAKENGHVVAVIGDGALTGGLAYEGLNNAGRFKKNFIVVLNDNKMSISRNVGAIARYLAGMRAKPAYLRVKSRVEWLLTNTPLVGKSIRQLLLTSKSALKNVLYKSTLFEDMGFSYHGPFDGHDIEKLESVFAAAKKMNHPVLIHVLTKKGKGYHFAEKDPKVFHGISSFDIQTGAQSASKNNFSEVFGAALCSLAEEDERICAITAAMKLGTGLINFAHKFRERFFDVGIAEEHAITFAGGLAAGGMVPVFAVYSSFLQRAYDQIIHDAAIQGLHIVIGVDRAGIVGEDGETHQGVFDVSFLNAIPNVTIFAPCYYDELSGMLSDAIYHCRGVVALRYPRGGELLKPPGFKSSRKAFDFFGDEDADILIITYGRLFSCACTALEMLHQKGIRARIMKLNRIKPIDADVFKKAARFSKIFFFEEGIQRGGIGEHFSFRLRENGYAGKYILTAIDDAFVPHSTVHRALHGLKLDAEGMFDTVVLECKNDG